MSVVKEQKCDTQSLPLSLSVSLLIMPYYTQVITLTKTTTTTVLVYKKDPLGYQIQTVYIEQGKYISENWRCECIDQDLQNWGK